MSDSDAYAEHAIRMWRFRQDQVDRIIRIVAPRGMTFVTAYRKDGESLTATESACPTCGGRQAETGPCKKPRCVPGMILTALEEVAREHERRNRPEPAVPADQRPTREVVHEAIRRADARGCCNLPACAFPPRPGFPGSVETMLCDELVAALEADRAARPPREGT